MHPQATIQHPLIISLALHFFLFLLSYISPFSSSFENSPTPMSIEFLNAPPGKKSLAENNKAIPAEQKLKTPTPSPAPKTKVEQEAAPKEKTPTPTPAPKTKIEKEVVKIQKKEQPKAQERKKQPVAPSIKKQEAKPTPPTPKAIAEQKKSSPGQDKKQQEVESVDALLKNLLPDTGEKEKTTDKKVEPDKESLMSADTIRSAISEIRSQIETVWRYNPTDNIDFMLHIKIDPTGKILDIKISGTNNQTLQQKAAAEAAYRATVRLEKFKLTPSIFKPEHHNNGWGEIDIHFKTL